MPVYMIPKHKVASMESKLQDGDIRGTMAVIAPMLESLSNDSQGRARFMHASTTDKKVVIDSTISEYLHQFKKHAGILVARSR